MIKSYTVTVRKCQPERLGSDVFLSELELERGVDFEAGPGQFVVLEPMNRRSVMTRPFAIVDVRDNVISLLTKVVGENTRAYSELTPGDSLVVMGPQGAQIPIDSKASRYILVAGGSAGAALTFCAKKITELGIPLTVLLGARKESLISGLDFFIKLGADVRIITNEGKGRTGFVSELLEEAVSTDGGRSIVVACGPGQMLQLVAEICGEYGNRCLVMLEEVMACGMGSCKGCAVFGKDGSIKHVCSDGPAFDAEWIDWQRLAPKSFLEFGTRRLDDEIRMKVGLGNLWLDYPFMNGSGTLSVEALENESFDISKMGALVTKGVTVESRVGNPMPRTCETPAGMINSIGLENIGIDRFISHELPRWIPLGKPVFVNISGYTIEEYMMLAHKLEDTEIAGLEVNISCPNIRGGGIIFGVDPKLAYLAVRAVRLLSSKIVIVKLSPNVTDIVAIAQAAVEAGADAISLINTFKAMAIDPLTRRPKIASARCRSARSGRCARARRALRDPRVRPG